MQWNLNPFYQISTSKLNVNPEENNFQPTLLYTQTHTKLSLTLHLANLTIILSSCLQTKIKAGSTSDSVNKKWSDEANAKLQDCFASTDWNIFRDSSDGIEEYTRSVTGFINKCIDDIVPTVTNQLKVCNQKGDNVEIRNNKIYLLTEVN